MAHLKNIVVRSCDVGKCHDHASLELYDENNLLQGRYCIRHGPAAERRLIEIEARIMRRGYVLGVDGGES